MIDSFNFFEWGENCEPNAFLDGNHGRHARQKGGKLRRGFSRNRVSGAIAVSNVYLVSVLIGMGKQLNKETWIFAAPLPPNIPLKYTQNCSLWSVAVDSKNEGIGSGGEDPRLRVLVRSPLVPPVCV